MYRIVLAVAGLVWGAATAQAGVGDLFEEKVKDFGTTPRGPVLVHYFRFTNTTGGPITVGQPRVSCGCVSASILKNQLAPGETTAVLAQMDTRRIPTPGITKSVTVYVPFLAPVAEEVSLRVQTVCRDDLMMSPDVLAFGTVQKGKPATVSTKVTFMSDPNWTITEATSTGGYVKVESKLDSRQGAMVTYDITAKLDKECPAGNWTSEIYLKTSNPAVASLRVPVTVQVSSPVSASPEAVLLGDVNMGASIEKQVIIQGTQPFKILKVNGTDEQIAAKVDNDDAKPVHVITLSVKAKTVGGLNRSVEFQTDNRDLPNVSVPVTGMVLAR